MIGRKIAGTVAAAMLLNATVATANTPTEGASSGLSSNRAALSIASGQDEGGSTTCEPGTANCATTVADTGGQIGKSRLYYILGGLAAAGGIIAIAASSGSKRSSGSGTTPVSP